MQKSEMRTSIRTFSTCLCGRAAHRVRELRSGPQGARGVRLAGSLCLLNLRAPNGRLYCTIHFIYSILYTVI